MEVGRAMERAAVLVSAAVAVSFLWGCACYKPYDVGKGETASSVARKFGLAEKDLRARNRMGEDYELRPGDRIFLPCDAEETKGGEGRSPSYAPAPKPHGGQDGGPEGKAGKAAPGGDRAKSAYASIPPGEKLAWPVEGKIVRRFSEGQDASANGVDIKTPAGAPVTAAAEGRVSYAGTPADAYGPMVILAHDNGLYTVYSHLGSLSTAAGAKLYRGERLGAAGSDSYVHFEVREGRKAVDPLLYLPRR